MPSNTFNTSSLVAIAGNQIIQSLHARSKLIKTVDKSKTSTFTQKKFTPGTTVSYDVRHQPNVVSGKVANVQDVVNRTESLTISQYNSSELFSSIEKSYSMDNPEDIRRYGDDMARRLIREMEVTGFAFMAKNTGNNVGTPGVDTGALRTYGEARAKLSDALAPDDTIFAAVNPQGMTALTDSLKGATNPGKQISDQYLRGVMQKAQGMNFYESNSIYRQTSGTTTDFAGAVKTTSVSGATSIVVDSLGTGTITAGTKITVADRYAVDPETKTTLSYLKQFSVTADATIASNEATLSISPTIYGSDSPHQNVSSLPTASDVVTIVSDGSGAGSKVDAQNIVYCPKAYTLASVPLAAAKDGSTVMKSYEGINIRIGVGRWDALNDEEIFRVDAVWGWGKQREDHACVVWGD